MSYRQTLRFYLNGVLHEVAARLATQTVLQYLREDLGLVGTKEGCSEGDCGACTVMQAVLSRDGRLVFRSINACIRLLPTIDGSALWTVESLAQASGALHPAQQALIDHHGSQCGFCTPGFVMSMATMYENGLARPLREEVLDHLSGNLCRCTGYRPIIDAATNMGSYPEVSLEHEAVQDQLLALQSQVDDLAWETTSQTYFAPTSTDDLARLYHEHPDSVLLAGGTDVGLWVTKKLKALPAIIYIGAVQELGRIERGEDGLVIGATVSLNEGYEALVAEYPEAYEIWKRFASMPIRNSGTLVGNLANGSPIGDSAPFLIAVGSKVILRKADRRRELALEDLYLDYGKQDREPGEFVESLVVPWRDPNLHIASYKLSKRVDQDISSVCSAYALMLDKGRVVDVRIAHGGMAATSRRALHAEKALIGTPWNEAGVALAMQALDRDYVPLSDMRATQEYRRKSARNLLYRFYLETAGHAGVRIQSIQEVS